MTPPKMLMSRQKRLSSQILFSASAIVAMFSSILLSSPSVQASEIGSTLSFNEALNEAIAHSPEFKISQAREDEASGGMTSALAGFLPSLSAFGFHYTDQKFQVFPVNFGGSALNVPEVIPTTSMKFSLNLPIFDGLKSVNTLKSATALNDAASENLRWEEFLVKQQVSEAFYRSLAAQQLADVAAENIRTLEDHYSHVQSRQKGGIATSYDVLRVEVQLDEAKTQKIQADDNVVLERKHLARLMGEPDDNRAISGELPVPEPAMHIDQLTADAARKNRKDLAALESQQRSADLADNADKAWWFPSFGAMADYEFYNNTTNSLTDSTPYHNDYDVGFYMRWNIFDGGQSVGKAKQSDARMRQAQSQLDVETQKLPEALETWKRRYQYGTALYTTSVSDIKKSEESVRQAKEGFKQGVRTVSEQLDAQLDLFRSRASKVNAQLNAAEALIQLELTVGRKLSHDDLN